MKDSKPKMMFDFRTQAELNADLKAYLSRSQVEDKVASFYDMKCIDRDVAFKQLSEAETFPEGYAIALSYYDDKPSLLETAAYKKVKSLEKTILELKQKENAQFMDIRRDLRNDDSDELCDCTKCLSKINVKYLLAVNPEDSRIDDPYGCFQVMCPLCRALCAFPKFVADAVSANVKLSLEIGMNLSLLNDFQEEVNQEHEANMRWAYKVSI